MIIMYNVHVAGHAIFVIVLDVFAMTCCMQGHQTLLSFSIHNDAKISSFFCIPHEIVYETRAHGFKI